MSKFIIVFTFCCILVFALVLESNKSNLWQKWNSTVLKASKSKGNLILLKVVRDGCHYCSEMERDVFNDPSVNAFVRSHFIPVKVNISHETMPLGLEALMTPSFYFINSEKKIIKRVLGAYTRDDFNAIMRNIIKAQ